jgi:hypothetical protein
MDLLVLAAITTFNLAIVMRLIFSPIIIAWLAQSDTYLTSLPPFSSWPFTWCTGDTKDTGIWSHFRLRIGQRFIYQLSTLRAHF